MFADGSKEMLSGCPNCGGNKFQFRPAPATTPDEGTSSPEGGATARKSDATQESERTAPENPSETRASGTAADAPDSGSGSDSVSDPDPGTGTGTSTAWSDAADRALGESSASADSDSDLDSDSDPDSDANSDREPLASSREWPNQRDEDESPPRRDTPAGGSASTRNAPDADPESEPEPRSESQPEPRSESQPEPRSESQPAPDSTEAASTAPTSDPTGSSTADTLSPDEPPEDAAQAEARSDVVSPDEIAAAAPDESERGPETGDTGDTASPPPDADGRVIEPSSDERPDLDELREELNEQFESIKIVAPGEYELNLMELYDRTEYIISLQEDGRYVIEVPDTWDTTPDPDDV